MIEQDLPRAIDGTTRRPYLHLASTDLQLRSYYGRCAWTPENIYVDINIGLSAANEPYRIEVTMRQGDKKWRREVARDEPRSDVHVVLPEPETGSAAEQRMLYRQRYVRSIGAETKDIGERVRQALSNNLGDEF